MIYTTYECDVCHRKTHIEQRVSAEPPYGWRWRYMLDRLMLLCPDCNGNLDVFEVL